MSPRQPVDRARIDLFLEGLGQRFRRPGRIHLVGGAMMVYEGFRGQTLDVDLTFDIAPDDRADFIQIVRALIDEHDLNVEEVSPADFIPLPDGYEERAQFIGRFGLLEAFHFDPYSVALSKIERGRDADFADVLALLDAGRIDFETLQSYFKDILPLMGARSLKQDPQEFRLKFDYLARTWQANQS